MRKMNHPNIIKLHEIHETEHSIYLVLDLVVGGDFHKKIVQKPEITPTDLRNTIKNLINAVNYIHKRGIIHRDLKPENILLRNEQVIYDIVLADFGLATFLKCEDIIFKNCGTPGYIAPEVIKFKQGTDKFYNEKCDVFSIGVIFFIL